MGQLISMTSRLAAMRSSGAVSTGSAGPSTSSTPLAEQAQIQLRHWSDYGAERETYLRDKYVPTRREAIKATPKISAITVYPPHATTTNKARLAANLKAGKRVWLWPDADITEICDAQDQEGLYALDLSKGTFRGGMGIFTPDDLAYAQSRPASTAWQRLQLGAEGPYSNPADSSISLSYTIEASGLMGLEWWCRAVPALHYLAKCQNTCPDDPTFKAHRAELEPLIAAGVTQAQLDSMVGGYVFDNPQTTPGFTGARTLGGRANLAYVGAAGKLAELYGSILPRGNGSTTPGTSTDGSSSIPWGTILFLGAIGAVIYFLFFRKG